MTRGELSDFEADVMFNVMAQNIPLTVTNNAGEHYAVACLDSEPVEVLLDRVMDAGGYATVFARGPLGPDGSYRVRMAAFIDHECALPDARLTDMRIDPPSADASVGMFFDYLETQAVGVLLPADLGLKADAVERARVVDFVTA